MVSSPLLVLFYAAQASAAPIQVAVESGASNTTAAALAAQLNDDTYYDFTATVVTASQIDSATELAAYDVVILGDSGYNNVDWTAAMANALDTWTAAGNGGVLSVGWVDWVTGPGASILTTIDKLQPIDSYSFHYGFYYNGATISVSSTSHPVTSGLPSSLAANANYIEGSPTGCDATNCQVLGTSTGGTNSNSGKNSIVVGEYGSGRIAYLGQLYMAASTYSNTGLRSGDADQLLEQTVAWIADAGDADGDGYTNATDCDDSDASINPGATEYCDGVDNNCDGTIDEASAVDAVVWYRDSDNDNYGDAATTQIACYQPAGYIADDTDCDDSLSSVYPGADEYCNGIDDDCDTFIDEDSAVDVITWYADSDADGYGNASLADIDCDQPTGYVTNNTDCDDTSSAVYPGADEYCNSIDDDCDGTIDEDTAVDASAWYRDADSDGYGNSGISDIECTQPSGYVADNTDCDDAVATTYPGADEYCNGVDDDCDTVVDEDTALDVVTWYQDSDSDGYGNASATDIDCAQPSGFVADATDCDDTVATTYPGADEYCNSVDDDCDGTIDEDTAVDASTWYEDADSDGYGNASVDDVECSQPSGYVADNTDCDDTVATTYPGADEYCNSVDDDCDGDTDEDTAVDAITWHEDADSDGYGNSAVTDVECAQPSGFVEDNTDCDDTVATTYPGADEYCNGIDDDCDTVIDEDDAVDVVTWFTDADSDGYGNPSSSDIDCDQPSGMVEDDTDCDDTDASIYPGATELEYDGIDQDCDGEDLCDVDLDSYNAVECGGSDCDDEDEAVNIDAVEIWYDGIDQDCDELSDYDADYDGFDSESYDGDDCDDADETVYPGAPDEPYDGIIADCDDADEYDADGDGYDAADYGGDDCDDANSSVNVDATEVWYDGVDQDCDGQDDDQDNDGYLNADDCDDTDPDSFPGAEGLDENCDEITDDDDDDDDGLSTDTAGLDNSDIDGGLDGATGGGGVACGDNKTGAGLGLLGLFALGLGVRRRRD